GPDGRSVIAAFNPGSYNGNISSDLSKSNAAPAGSAPGGYVWDWPKRVEKNGEVSGLYTDYRYYGVGDTGGAPREPSVKLLNAIVNKGSAVIPPARNPNESFADYQQR